ncbi:MAG: type II toxin-antitoxin system PemK/MazF family toxin [Candidatus Kerfeldbacteria bacterium]|nr:type II toxin-antitoxin system PemK/MazF family toxin [Candidatus Kerfeldbacteria bacterium]
MKTYSIGDVVLATLPFTSGSGAKQRPALVLVDTGDDDCILAVITSKTRTGMYDVNLTDWKKANLLFPSIVRVHKLYTIGKPTILGILGRATENDLKHVRSAVRKLWNDML